MAKRPTKDYNHSGQFRNHLAIVMQSNYFGLTKIHKILPAAFKKWGRDQVPRIASSLAFYTGLSLAPLLVFAVGVVGVVYSGETAQDLLVRQVESAMGESGVEVVQNVLSSATDSSEGIIASILSLAVLIFSASNLFLQMQAGFNTIWRTPPLRTKGLVNTLLGRLRAFLAVIFVGILMLGIVVLNSVVANIERIINSYTPFLTIILPILNVVFGLGILMLVFMIMFRRLTAKKIRTRDVVLGALVAAILFQLGNIGLSFYLANASVGSAYGAAGSLLVVLVWFFYTMQIILLGAEVSYVYAHTYGSRAYSFPDPGPDGPQLIAAVQKGAPRSIVTSYPVSRPDKRVRNMIDNVRARFSRP